MASIEKNDLLEAAVRFLDESAVNYLDAEVALRPDLAGMRFFDAPLMAVGAAGDPIFELLKSDEAVGPMFMTPEEWLPGAKSVISFFLPFEERIITANLGATAEIPPEWLHGRIEGQTALNAMVVSLRDLLIESDCAAIIPTMDDRFESGRKPDFLSRDGEELPGYTSSWSERHVAYACGLGTFGLSRGLITKRGTAGRFGSIITDLPLAPDVRPYSRYDEYCNLCGECAARCPVGAIDVHKGKNMAVCAAFMQKCTEKYSPRYGCGKCNVGVQCATGVPGGASRRKTTS